MNIERTPRNERIPIDTNTALAKWMYTHADLWARADHTPTVKRVVALRNPRPGFYSVTFEDGTTGSPYEWYELP